MFILKKKAHPCFRDKLLHWSFIAWMYAHPITSNREKWSFCYWGTIHNEFHHHWMPLNNQLHTGALHETAHTVHALHDFIFMCAITQHNTSSTLQISWLWLGSLEDSPCGPRQTSTHAVCWLINLREYSSSEILQARLILLWAYFQEKSTHLPLWVAKFITHGHIIWRLRYISP